jgi:hypothetical protein
MLLLCDIIYLNNMEFFQSAKQSFVVSLKKLYKIKTRFDICVSFPFVYVKKRRNTTNVAEFFVCIVVIHSFLLCVLDVIFALVDFFTV